ncbi:PilW family protein [Blastopirellula retiformator]|uniref:Prepilin-type N-terminal cleavage/methylation domain-containing protein n=1 Tax=Blastopirellula retiformator TaxID=2527970 RepID=A0A5C5V1G4_9BACT|nr:prepilin-type N-terminal cleavage/methylation domain-containing protein [Blastopirellula retiformator]TWT31849.1 hypothetical protein Enr8_37740 [Blastopirellula retiformator]
MTEISASPRARRGLTLVEMLVATTLTLILFFSVAQIFAFLGDTMHDARSTIELSGNMRGLTTTMQNDLDCHTAPGLPWVGVGANLGYFTVVEGPDRDGDFAGVTSVGGDADDIIAFTAYSKEQPFVGLIQGELIRQGGRLCIADTGATSPITSHYAEIIYWTEFTPYDDADGDGLRDADETVTLFRRVLLIRPDIDFQVDTSSYNSMTGVWGSGREITQLEAFNNFDLSLRPSVATGNGAGDWTWRTNSLEDLQSRNNRHGTWMIRSSQASTGGGAAESFDEPTTMPHSAPGAIVGRAVGSFPHLLRPRYLRSFEKMNEIAVETGSMLTGIRDRTGEDVLMSKILAFDVKVFDPYAPILVHSIDNDMASIPGDIGFATLDAGLGTIATGAGTGAYVDLNWIGLTNDPSRAAGSKLYDNGHFAAIPTARSQARNQTIPLVANHRSPSVANGRDLAMYDTWPALYESDGVDQDSDMLTDEGTNGVDDDGLNGVDDPGEHETAPPYERPLRGIQITIRAIEDGSRLIRQDTVTANLMTE